VINLKKFEQFYEKEIGWTKAFQCALAKLKEQQGGILFLPAGCYETGPLELTDGIFLYLEAGATLKFIPEESLYSSVRLSSNKERKDSYHSCIYAHHAKDIGIGGKGTIDGQGSFWWENKDRLCYQRPNLICFEECTRVKIEDLKLVNSPSWTIHPLLCNDVEIRGVSIQNPKDSPNTDGINPESCANVRITDCFIDVGDDCITLKAGTEDSFIKASCENIVIMNCTMIHGHGGVVVGSEMSGGVHNITIANCVFQDTDRGIRVKTRRGRGGSMERILVNNIIMDRVLCPFTFNMFYRCGAQGTEYKEKKERPVDAFTPAIRKIQISNVMVNDASASAGFFYGLPELPIEEITMADCRIRMADNAVAGNPAMMEDIDKMKQAGIYMRYAQNVVLRNVSISNYIGKEIEFDHTVLLKRT